MVRVIGFMLEDLAAEQLRDLRVGSGYHGRLLVTHWILTRLAAHPTISEIASCCPEMALVPGIASVSFGDLDERLSAENAVWLEPARHYWWKPGVIRRSLGQSFPIVSLMHSIGYPSQVEPLIASLAVARSPGDTIVAPSFLAAQAFLDQCQGLAEVLGIYAPPPDVAVIPYGIPPVRSVPYAAARQALGWAETPVVLFVGRLREDDKADFDALFEACARIASEDVSFRLVLAGAASEGQDTVLLDRSERFGLRETVEVRANVSETEKHLLLSGCDMFVSPSNSVTESFGLSIIEAMMHGRPVVCSSWSGYREIVRDGTDGFLVETWWDAGQGRVLEIPFTTGRPVKLSTCAAIDIDHMKRCLAQLLLQPDLRLKFGESARQRAASCYLIDRTVASLADLLRDARARCPQTVTAPRSTRVVGALGRFASRLWAGDESLRADGSVNLERAMRTGAVKSGKDLASLQAALAGSRGLGDGTFNLLRRGMLRVAHSGSAAAREACARPSGDTIPSAEGRRG